MVEVHDFKNAKGLTLLLLLPQNLHSSQIVQLSADIWCIYLLSSTYRSEWYDRT